MQCSHDSVFIPFFKNRGNFDSPIDRVFSTTQYGGLLWQYTYDSKQEENKSCFRTTLLTIKAATLVLVFCLFLSVSFILGLATAGVFWPPFFRRIMFGSVSPVESYDMWKEEIFDLKNKNADFVNADAELRKKENADLRKELTQKNADLREELIQKNDDMRKELIQKNDELREDLKEILSLLHRLQPDQGQILTEEPNVESQSCLHTVPFCPV